MNIYLQLFLTFAKIGVVTFGGGAAMLPILQREVVENKHWATEEELVDYYAIGQCTPGIIAVNTATFVGQKLKGLSGGIFATLGMVFPSLVIISILAGLHQLCGSCVGAECLCRHPGLRVRADLQRHSASDEKIRGG